MSRNLFDAVGTFNGSRVEPRAIDYAGESFSFGVRVISSGEAMRILDITDSNGKKNPAKAKAAKHKFLAATITDAEGKRSMTVEEVAALEFGLSAALEKAAMEVNGLDTKAADDAGKSSPGTDD